MCLLQHPRHLLARPDQGRGGCPQEPHRGLARGKLRPKIPQLTAAPDGHFGAHHAIVAARILAYLDFLDATIAELDAQIAKPG